MEIKSLTGKRWFIWSLVIIVVALVGLATYITLVSQNDSSQVSIINLNHRPKTQPNVRLQPPKNTTDFETYTNTKYGFSFQYPDTFIIDTSTSSDPESFFNIYDKQALATTFESGGSIDVAIWNKTFDQVRTDLIDMINRNSAKTVNNLTVNSQIKEAAIILGGHLADKLEYPSSFGGNVTDYIFFYKNQTFSFETDSETNVAENIIQNLK